MSDRVARSLLQDSGMPLPVEELLFGDVKRNPADSDLDSALQVLKRRRLHGKQHATDHRETARLDWAQLLASISPGMRKGKVYYREGDRVLEDAQKLTPNMVVKHVVVCKGTNRIQPLPAGCASRDAPLRYTVLVKRDGGEMELDDHMEEWSKLPRYKQMRHCTPAKMSLTAYGHAVEQLRTFWGAQQTSNG